MEHKDNNFFYRGGFVNKDIVIDPDYMTWSMFEGFCEDNGSSGSVKYVWYKLPQETMDLVRTISELTSDSSINQMCGEAMKVGAVDIYIEQNRGEKERVDEEVQKDGEEERGEEDRGEEERSEEDRDDERQDNGEQSNAADEVEEEIIEDGGQSNAADEVEEEIIEDGGEDIPFQSLFGDIREEEVRGEANDDEEVRGGANDDEEEESERQLRDVEHPAPTVDTDDEWEDFNRQEKVISRTRYSNEKPPYLWLMQTFNSGEEFKDQLLRYVLKTNYDVKLCRWEKTKLGAICTNVKCKWKIYCSVEKPKGKWMVKSYVDGHNHMKSSKARMLKQGTIARLYKDEARRRPGIKWTDIKDEIMMRYNLSVSKWICTKARRMALDLVIETQREQFAKLWDYEKELQRSNENTKTEIVTIPREDGKFVFDRFYICFENLRNTWKRCCRPIIGLDGAFMKWELKGEILAAVGRDADNRIYPIAWAIVRVEDNASWGWFVDKLKSDLELGLGNGFTIISDKQKGLINAIADLLPGAEHRHCARHIFANWKKVYGQSEYEDYFWAIAYSFTQGDYQYNLHALEVFDAAAHEDLLKTEPKTWCRAFFSPHARCEDVCNNLSESFNRTIREARKLPLINMLEEIRRLAMKRNSRRHDKTSGCSTPFPPNIMEIFEQNRKASKHCTVIKSSESLYEVTEFDCSYLVCLPQQHCACNRWDITGIPCQHAIYVINEHNKEPAE